MDDFGVLLSIVNAGSCCVIVCEVEWLHLRVAELVVIKFGFGKKAWGWIDVVDVLIKLSNLLHLSPGIDDFALWLPIKVLALKKFLKGEEDQSVHRVTWVFAVYNNLFVEAQSTIFLKGILKIVEMINLYVELAVHIQITTSCNGFDIFFFNFSFRRQLVVINEILWQKVRVTKVIGKCSNNENQE